MSGLVPVAAITSWLGLLAAALLVLLPAAPLGAVSASDLPSQPPEQRVLDQAELLSRSTTSELQRRLEALGPDRISAHLVTVKRLDYGLSADQLAQQLVDRWQMASSERQGELLLLIDGQNNTAAIAVSGELEAQLSPEMLRSTASATMGLPLRDGARYRQASLDALDRLSTVLSGADDPGPPVITEFQAVPSNIPTQEETAGSKALLWVVVLLVAGTVVPMLTWWVFSR